MHGYWILIFVLQGLTSLIYLCSTDMYALINYVGFVNWLSIGGSVVVLLYFRWKRPTMNRPIKVSFVQIQMLLMS